MCGGGRAVAGGGGRGGEGQGTAMDIAPVLGFDRSGGGRQEGGGQVWGRGGGGGQGGPGVAAMQVR